MFLIIKVEVEEFLKVVLQEGSKDCGVCSLLSIIRYYGGDVSREYLRELTGTNKSGVSFYQLLEAARQLGFSCEGVKGEITYLDVEKIPCIAHIVYQKKYQHFVVIYQVDFSRRELILMDPAKGKVVLSFSEFQMLSSGYYLYLVPIKKLPIFYEKNSLLFFVKNFCYRYRRYLFFIFIFSVFIIIFQLVIAFHFQYLFDYAIQFSIYDSLFSFSLFLFLFYLGQLFFRFIKNFIFVKVSSIFDEELMLYIYKQILLLPYLFFKNRTLGEVLERLQDAIKVKNFILQLVTTLMSDALFFLLFLYLLSQIHSFFLLLFVGYFVLSFIIGIFSYRLKKKKQKRILVKSDGVQSFLIESFQNVDTLKGLHLEYEFLEQFGNNYRSYLSHLYLLERLLIFEQQIKQFFSSIMYLLFYGFGAYLLIIEKISVAQFFICQHVFHYLIGCSDRILSFFFENYQIPLSFSRVQDLFSLFRENFDGGSYYQLMTLEGDIVFSHLSFSYSSKELFSDFSFSISYGKKVLLTGKSGGGKSSLVKILMRYIEVPYGMVRIGSMDINHFHLELLRNRISYVTGGELLFSNTLYYNITLNREVDQEKVDCVAKMVLLDDLLEKLPLGYQTMVEENGFNFSSGERQKILLARALLKNSDIYIFDEAFHQIDILQEGIILQNIFSYLREKTVIIISHRLNHFELYDYRYRLEGGVLYEI